MRIAMLTNNYKPFVGGVPISIERLSESLRRLGHEVYIFAPTYANQVEEAGVIRYKSYKKKLKGGLAVPHFFDREIGDVFKQLEIDVIHVHHPNFVGWMATYLGNKYDVPVVYTYHTRYEQYIHNVKGIDALERLSQKDDTLLIEHMASSILKKMREEWVPSAIRRYANKCDAVIAPTTLMKEVLEEMGVTAPIAILPTGIGEQFFEKDSLQVQSIRNHYKGDKKYLFCTVARLAREKNISFLIEGPQRVKAQIGDCFKMLVIGDGPLKGQLQEEIKKLGLQEQVVLVGNVANEQIKNYYGACDLFLFASKSETQGIVLLEAMATGIPVVAVEASGVVEVVKNGVNGYMTPECLETWANCVSQTITQQDAMEKLKGGAYETARDFTGEEVAKRALCCYSRALKNHCTQTRYRTEKAYA